jgi:CubicO group peptidase (beta-lactamase class C family)/mannose-6-phosphate isomerase-like protein (cupin superfamily)
MNLKIFFIAFIAFNLKASFNVKQIDSYLKKENFSGAILISKKDTIIFKKYYGYANHEFEIPNSKETKFLIASNTKSFTAVAIIQLQEKKLLNVQDKLSTYIPDFPNGNIITIHHLLTHTSGIPNYYKYWTDVSNAKNLEEMVKAFKSWPLEFEAGSQYAYSNSNYSLLAYIIEKVSGLKYEEYMTENIFKPLNMHNTGSFNSVEKIIKNKAYGYCNYEGSITIAPAIKNPITLLGNGDLYSTLDDMHAWDQALYTEKLISKKNRELMYMPHVSMEGSLTRAHSYGWFIDTYCNKRIVEYSGALIGYLSKIIRFIDDEISIIIITNVENQGKFCLLCDNILKLLFTPTKENFMNEYTTEEIQNIIDAWQEFLQNNDWHSLTKNCAPIKNANGLVYELPNYLNRVDESIAIVDMHNLTYAEPHYHPDLEIYFVLEGEAVVVLGNKPQTVQTGDIIVIPPYKAHYSIPIKNFVLACVNKPPFKLESYIPLISSAPEVEFDYDYFNHLVHEANKHEIQKPQ